MPTNDVFMRKNQTCEKMLKFFKKSLDKRNHPCYHNYRLQKGCDLKGVDRVQTWDNLAKKHVYKCLQKKRIHNTFGYDSHFDGIYHIIHWQFTKKTLPQPTEISTENAAFIQVRGLDWLHSTMQNLEKYVNCHIDDNLWNVLCIVILNHSRYSKQPHLTYVIPRERIKKADKKYKLHDNNGNIYCTKGGLIKLEDFGSAKGFFDAEFKERWEFIDVVGKYYIPPKSKTHSEID